MPKSAMSLQGNAQAAGVGGKAQKCVWVYPAGQVGSPEQSRVRCDHKEEGG